MNKQSNNQSRLLAAGFLIVLVAVLVGGGVALYRNGAFSANDNVNVNTTTINSMNSAINDNGNTVSNVNNSAPAIVYTTTTDQNNGKITIYNNQYTFSFKIPSDWTIKDNTDPKYFSAFDPVAIAHPSETDLMRGMKLEIVVEPLLSGETFNGKVDDAIAMELTIENKRTDNLTVNGQPAVRLYGTSSFGDFALAYVKSGNAMVRVIGNIAESNDVDRYQSLYNDIFNSFVTY